MGIDLYYMAASAPCRSIIMAAKELNIPLELKPLDLFKKEQLSEEFVKINPVHCVPTIVDHDHGEFSLWESRAILAYLVNQYAPGHSLYPSDPKKRAEVDKILYMDIGTIYKTLADWMYPHLMKGEEIDEAKVAVFREKLALLDGHDRIESVCHGRQPDHRRSGSRVHPDYCNRGLRIRLEPVPQCDPLDEWPEGQSAVLRWGQQGAPWTVQGIRRIQKECKEKWMNFVSIELEYWIWIKWIKWLKW